MYPQRNLCFIVHWFAVQCEKDIMYGILNPSKLINVLKSYATKVNRSRLFWVMTISDNVLQVQEIYFAYLRSILRKSPNTRQRLIFY